MSVIIGIDVGGSTTKIVGFDKNKNIIEPMFVKANDPITSVYGAFGKFTDANSIDLGDIEKIMVTGVGSSYLNKPIYGLDCCHVGEFDSIGTGGLYLSGLDKGIVVSMGTGTAMVIAERGRPVEYVGGTGVGGGTLTGLSKNLIGVSHVQDIVDLAKTGDLSKVDLCVSDMTAKSIKGMTDDLTAANFGKTSDLASKNDLAYGLLNMVFETVAMLSLFAARDKGTDNIIMTGNLTVIYQAKDFFDRFTRLFGKNYFAPKYSNFATAIGAALLAFDDRK